MACAPDASTRANCSSYAADVGQGRRAGELVGADAAGDPAADRLGLGGAAADQLGRARPVQAHAALRGVHRLGDARAVRPQVAAEGEGGVPVDGGGAPGLLSANGSATTCAARTPYER
jgi:hypothetical protein